MKRIQFIFLGFVLLLAACTSATTEPAAIIDESPAMSDEVMESETAVEEPVEADVAVEEEIAVEETAVKPQFVMFTASW